MKNLVITKKRKKYQVTVNDTGPLYAYITSLNYLLFISDGYYNGGYRLIYHYEELRIGEKSLSYGFWERESCPAFAVMLSRKHGIHYSDFRLVLSHKYVKKYGKYFLYGT